MSYKTMAQEEIEKSPQYIVKHYRNVPEQREEELDEFLYWLEYDCEEDLPVAIWEIKALVDQYLGRDLPKIKQSELALLEAWTLSTKGE